MRNLKNVEIINYVFEKLNGNKEYAVDYDKILALVDDSIANDNDFEKDENGDIARKMTDEEIQNLKDRMLNGIEEYFDEIFCQD